MSKSLINSFLENCILKPLFPADNIDNVILILAPLCFVSHIFEYTMRKYYILNSIYSVSSNFLQNGAYKYINIK